MSIDEPIVNEAIEPCEGEREGREQAVSMHTLTFLFLYLSSSFTVTGSWTLWGCFLRLVTLDMSIGAPIDPLASYMHLRLLISGQTTLLRGDVFQRVIQFTIVLELVAL